MPAKVRIPAPLRKLTKEQFDSLNRKGRRVEKAKDRAFPQLLRQRKIAEFKDKQREAIAERVERKQSKAHKRAVTRKTVSKIIKSKNE